MSRLRLDFSLNTSKERTEFINKYVTDPKFQKKPLTEEELEMCGNYILWGKDENGKNSVQEKDVQIQTRNSTWNSTPEIESLEELTENPAFNEAQIKRPTQARILKRRETFSREEALQKAPEPLKQIYLNLFNRIDTLDLIINYYDLDHGKRKNPPRPQLLNKFSVEEQNKLKEKANDLNQYNYLKMRHLLVELRREQFSIRDSYSETIQRNLQNQVVDFEEKNPIFDADVQVFPLGLKSSERRGRIIFQENINPKEIKEEDLKIISDFIWYQKNLKKQKVYFDFRELEHVYQLVKEWDNFQVHKKEVEVDSTLFQIMDTLDFYMRRAHLTEIQNEIFFLKAKKIKNQDIANYINNKYNKSYTANYISTIFRQKIIKRINEAAQRHWEEMNIVFFPEEFKKCNCCEKFYPKTNEYFAKKGRTQDGFSGRCKECDKKIREMKKGVQ